MSEHFFGFNIIFCRPKKRGVKEKGRKKLNGIFGNVREKNVEETKSALKIRNKTGKKREFF